MLKKLTLVLTGRPNVGKSTLFNRICQKRVAIVDEHEGTTRDRIYGQIDGFGYRLTLIDTGGIGQGTKAAHLFHPSIQKQVESAWQEADIILLLVDGQVGLTAADEYLSRQLQRQNKPLYLIVNKIDNSAHTHERLFPFYRLGIQKIFPVSALQGDLVMELLEKLLANPPYRECEATVEKEEMLKVALVGRPNVGKSSLLNYLLQEERSIISEIPGTTRDAIDVQTILNGIPITFIDTAGIRRRRAQRETVDKFAAVRTQLSIERSDICLLLLDAKEGITVQDKKIAQLIEEAGKGCILLFNKWDLVTGCRMEYCLHSFRMESPFLNHCPALFISALTGRNLFKIAQEIFEVSHFQNNRIPTGELNQWLEETVKAHNPPTVQGKRLKIYYMTQVKTNPPTFILFINSPRSLLNSYKKYLIHQLRKRYLFSGNPLFFIFKDKNNHLDPA